MLTRAAPLRPEGAQGCSHGWSAGRRQATAAQPVDTMIYGLLHPGEAEEDALRAYATAFQ